MRVVRSKVYTTVLAERDEVEFTGGTGDKQEDLVYGLELTELDWPIVGTALLFL